MTDNLRDRIAAATCNWYYGVPTAWEETSEPSRQDWRGCADAVITELSRTEKQMSKYQIGSLIAIQGGDGKVYMGIVSSNGTASCTVDVIADDIYRGAKPHA